MQLFRKSIFFEGSFKNRLRLLQIRSGETFYLYYETGVGISDGKGITIFIVRCFELPFVIGTPNIVTFFRFKFGIASFYMNPFFFARESGHFFLIRY